MKISNFDSEVLRIFLICVITIIFQEKKTKFSQFFKLKETSSLIFALQILLPGTGTIN